MEKDWRLACGQEDYMKNIKLCKRKFPSKYKYDAKLFLSDHTHCEFCMRHIVDERNNKINFNDTSNNDVIEGYVMIEYPYYWICPQCFSDFETLLNFIVIKGA